MWADQAFDKLISDYQFNTVLDVGSGDGEHAQAFRNHGKRVTTVSLQPGADYVGDFNTIRALPACDLVWCSHVLEHQRNPGQFLDKCRELIRPGDLLAVTVPPLKHEIVGGHVSLWNAGILLYHLILAGFDCRNAAVKCYGYNISVIVERSDIELPGLDMDSGDIHKLKKYFPMPVDEGFDGKEIEVNWR